VQARRVFAHRQNVTWVAADIFCPPFGRSFNVVVMASSIQYFPDLSQLIEALLPILRDNGEIHILDSPLYSKDDLPAARERSRRYYEQLGFPSMAAHYHHHTPAALDPYHPVWLYHPDPSVKDSPFPWIRLRPGLQSTNLLQAPDSALTNR
jgi:SAM-dependent methyltransferase